VFVVAICIDLPIFLWLATRLIERDAGAQLPALAWINAGAWLIAVVIVACLGASAFAGERTGQTLDVLLTTPVSTRDLVRQKARWAWGVMWILSLPIAAAVVVGAAMEHPPGARPPVGRVGYLICSALAVGLLMPLTLWMGIWIGIVVRDRGRAIMVVLVTLLVLLALAPTMVAAAVDAFGGSAWLRALYLLSPGVVVWVNERMTWESVLGGHPWAWMVANFLLWGGAAAAMRWTCLYRADRHLGRVSDSGSGIDTNRAADTG